MSTHNMHLKYRTPKRYPTIISILPPIMALVVTFRGSNYRCPEQIFMVPKGFEPSKFDFILDGKNLYKNLNLKRGHLGKWVAWWGWILFLYPALWFHIGCLCVCPSILSFLDDSVNKCQ